jgi:protein-S-isoprenylcysteine O-methyltransferase Ste14
MTRLIIFIVLSIPIIILSWRTIFNTKSHGFYRFFSWECIIWLLATNYTFWFKDPFLIHQIFSWILLLLSIFLVATGVLELKKGRNKDSYRNEGNLYQFEKTTNLVESGIFKYIRHPLYSSLLFLTWGIFLKNPQAELFIVSGFSTLFLYLTAIHDEKECVAFFGNKYSEYMSKTEMFIPFIF